MCSKETRKDEVNDLFNRANESVLLRPVQDTFEAKLSLSLSPYSFFPFILLSAVLLYSRLNEQFHVVHNFADISLSAISLIFHHSRKFIPLKFSARQPQIHLLRSRFPLTRNFNRTIHRFISYFVSFNEKLESFANFIIRQFNDENPGNDS